MCRFFWIIGLSLSLLAGESVQEITLYEAESKTATKALGLAPARISRAGNIALIRLVQDRDGFRAELLEAKEPYRYTPTFSVRLDIAPDHWVSGDFNGDGHDDLMISNSSGQALYLKGNDLGQLDVGLPLELPADIAGLKSADLFRRDGISDLIVYSLAGNRPTVFHHINGLLHAEPRLLSDQEFKDLPQSLRDFDQEPLRMFLNDDRIPDPVILDDNGSILARISKGGLILEVNSTDDVDDGTCDASHCSLREAINAADETPDIDTITFSGLAVDDVIVMGASSAIYHFEINESVIIDGTTHPAGMTKILGSGSISTHGMRFKKSNNTVKGLVMGNFDYLCIDFSVSSHNNLLERCHFGLDRDGLTPLGGSAGVQFLGDNNQIGIAEAGRGNVFWSRIFTQLNIEGDNNTLVNNFLGVNIAGEKPLPVGVGSGLRIRSDNHTIGGLSAYSGNVIAGKPALYVPNYLNNALIQGNYLNVNPNSLTRLEEVREAMYFNNTTQTTVGGTTPEAANIMASAYYRSDYDNAAIYIEKSNTMTFHGNYIGVAPDGRLFGQEPYGFFFDGSNQNGISTIGGTDPGTGNTIGGFEHAVVFEQRSNPAAETTRISILGNSMRTTGQAVLLSDTYVPNDPGDTDTGTNNLQNHPVLMEPFLNGSDEVIIEYQVDSQTGETQYPLRIEIFETNASNSHDGYRLIATDVYSTTDFSNGLKTINLGLLNDLNLSTFRSIVANATDNWGNTSQFSPSVYLTQPSIDPLVVNALDDIDDGTCDSDHCSLREAIRLTNSFGTAFSIRFNLPDPYEIQVQTPLPEITAPLHLDGSSQPGFAGTAIVTITGANETLTDGLFLHTGAMLNNLRIHSFPGSQVRLIGNANRLEGNILGFNLLGELPMVAGMGLSIDASSQDNLIGGTLTAQGNLISRAAINGPQNLLTNNRITATMWVTGELNRIGDDTGTTGNRLTEVIAYGAGSRFSNNYFGILEDGSSLTDHLRTNSLELFGDDIVVGSDGGNVFAGNSDGSDNVGIIVRSNNAVIENNSFGIDASGSSAIGCQKGIEVTPLAMNCMVIGNTISGCGVAVDIHADMRFQDNYVGTDASGQNALGNDQALRLMNGEVQVIDNVIAGNRNDGVFIFGGTHTLTGNRIGVNAANQPLGNEGSGIHILSSGNHIIGGTTAASQNTISGNGLNGIDIIGPSASNLLILGNRIGTDITGTTAIGNTLNGIYIENSAENTIGTSSAGNQISGNGRGIFITGITARQNRIENNLIGLDESGNLSLGNRGNGIEIKDARSTRVLDNSVGGNRGTGISVHESGAVDNRIFGNMIGVSAALQLVPNGLSGISIEDAPANRIGGSGAGEANIIAGNKLHGIQISGKTANNNSIIGNYIGTDTSGNLDLGNQVHGLFLSNTASYTQIGGQALNLIAFNGGDGIRITDGIGNDLITNAVYNNHGLGIDLNGDGLTSNDLTDMDVGGNMLLNYPELTAVTDQNGSFTVSGSLTSQPNSSYTIAFYLNDDCSPGGYGQGQMLVGTTLATTAANGIASFSESFNTPITASQVVTALTLDQDSNTSEFSRCEGVSIFADGFESGDTSRWTLEGGTRSASDLSIENDARYDGLYGLRVYPGDAELRLRDDSPANEMRYRLRFYANFKNIQVGDETTTDFYAAYNSQDEAVLILRLSAKAGQLIINALVREDGGGWLKLADIPISQDWQLLELDLLASSEGHFVIYTNGKAAASITNLDNDAAAVDRIRVGVVNPTQGDVTGYIDLDDFKAGRDLYIGGLICVPFHLWGAAMEEWPNRKVNTLLNLATSHCR